jgi:hypothetical protein
MKKIILCLVSLGFGIVACNTKTETKPGNTATSINLPYKPGYTSDFTNNVSDSDLLLALNTYKYWESGDLKGLRETMGDSMSVNGASGFTFNGRTDSLMKTWQLSRDSLASVKITMDAWIKIHSNKDTTDYINTWYKEIDTYKIGKVDSANYSDVNQLKNGKVVWYSSFRQNLKK